ncbi:MAG: DNA repair protein RecO [bacterium]|nr:DNA repair protein RecO [bacterium]
MQTINFIKTTGICLNIRPFSKTSQMVTWLTPDVGRLTTPIKGAQRPKSAFLGKCDIGYTCEIIFYAKDHNGVHHIKECHPINFREGLHTHWRVASVANYVCDLAMRTAQPNLANPALYNILVAMLDTLHTCQRHELSLALLWFESRVLHAIGVQPDFTICPHCPPQALHAFSTEEGRFYCEHRPSRLTHPPTLTLHDDLPTLFFTFLKMSLDEVLQQARATNRTDDLGRPEPFPGIFGLRRFLGVFINTHLDLAPGPRRTVLDLII